MIGRRLCEAREQSMENVTLPSFVFRLDLLLYWVVFRRYEASRWRRHLA